MSARSRPARPSQLADLRRQVEELQRQSGALTTLVLDQQGRIRALSTVSACLLAVAAERADAPAQAAGQLRDR